MTVYVGFEIEVEGDGNTSLIYYLAEKTRHITGLDTITVQQYHQHRGDSVLGKWRLEHDTSLSNGAEFITPPLEINNALETLEKFLTYIDKCKCFTTERTGLHINMSSNNMCLDDININNIIPQINYKLLFNLWSSRFEKNMYSRSLRSLIQTNKQAMLYAYCSNLYSGEIEKLNAVNKILLGKRTGFINLRKNTDRKRYFEIRIAGGKEYHKKFKSIEQTVRHFEKILLNSQKNPTKSYKSLISYVNRTFTCDKKNKLFIPSLFNTITPYAFIKKDIPLIKNVHNYNIEQLHTEIRRIHNEIYFLEVSPTLLNVINIYFRQYIKYIYKDPNHVTIENREKERNYVIYHYYKYIYNNCGKAECIKALQQERHIRLYSSNRYPLNSCFDFSIPEDEPKQKTLWLIGCVKELDTVTKKQFVSKLPLGMLNFLLTHKRPGMINVTKKARKELIKEMTVQNKKIKEETVMG